MSEPTHVGRVFVWGLDGTLSWEGLLDTENEPQSMTFKDEVKSHETLNKKGQTIAVQLWNPAPMITIKALPCSATSGDGAIEDARKKTILPAKGSKVSILGFPPDTTAADDVNINSARWLYLGGGDFAFNNEKEVEVTLPLKRFAEDLAVNNS